MEYWEENIDEIFDLKPILPEIYTSHPLISNHPTKAYGDQASIRSETKQKISINPSSSSSSSSCPKLISFENSNTFDHVSTNSKNSNLDHHDMANKDYSNLAPQVINFSSSAPKDDDFGNYNQILDASNERVCISTRNQLQARDHLLAERKRRENLGQLFISLSKVVPGLKKLDKASLLEEAINHLKALQERISVLEEEMINIDNIESSINNSTNDDQSTAAEIKARISNKHVLIKIHCKKQKGLMSKIPCQMEKMHLSVLDMRIMPFGDDALDITILAEMQSEFHGTVKGIVDHLQMIFFSPRRDNMEDNSR